MQIICAWCRIILVHGPSHPISHGICESCARLWEASSPIIVKAAEAAERERD